MGSNVGKDAVLCSVSTQAVKAVATVPVWVKLTPATATIVDEARATFLGGADAIVSSNTFPSVPLVDPETGEFEVNVDGFVSSGGMGGPAILPLSLAKMAEMTQAFPDRAFSGIGGIADLRPRAQLLPARLRHGPGRDGGHAGPRDRTQRDPGPDDGHDRVPGPQRRPRLDAPRGLPRAQPRPDRPPFRHPPADDTGYHGGYEEDDAEGYAASLAKV